MRISDWSSDVCSSDRRTVGIVLALRNILEYGVEQGAHIAFAHVFCKTRIPSQARGVNDGEIQLLFCCTQLVEQVEGGVDGKIRQSTRLEERRVVKECVSDDELCGGAVQ